MAKKWEIDEFHGKNKGLWLAEIELDNINESFSKPDWALDDVSNDERYFNSYLSTNPFCSW
jgi:adenylate cyclase